MQEAIDRDKGALAEAPPKPGEHWYQRLGMAMLAATKLAPYAQQIVHPVWSQQMAAREGTEKELKELTGAQEQEARGALYRQQSDEMATQGKMRPILRKDGSLINPLTGAVITPAITASPADRKKQALDLGADDDTALAYSLGLKPSEIIGKDPGGMYVNPNEATAKAGFIPDPKTGKVYIPKEGVAAYTANTIKEPSGGSVLLGPDRVSQFNHALASSYQVAHPNAPLPPHYTLGPNATEKDFENISKMMDQEDRMTASKAVQDAAKAQRDAAFAALQESRRGKVDIATQQAGIKAFTPAMDSAERFNVMTQNYEDAVRSHDQQAMLSLLANHLGMTMGMQKGARLTQAIINEASKSAPWLQSIAAKFDSQGYLAGLTLTPEQMRQMVDLGRSRYTQDLSKARNEAQYIGVKDDGPKRIPSRATINYYTAMAQGDAQKAKDMAASDGWSVN